MALAMARPSVGLPRLLSALSYGEMLGLERHLEAHGPLPNSRELDPGEIVDLVERAGLRGRGGAAFPTATKLRAVLAARGRPIVVVNGCESEPISAKDALLMRELPHLVLDGAAIAARAVGADEAVIAFEAPNLDARNSLELALDERRAARRGRTRPFLAVRGRGAVPERARDRARLTAQRRSRETHLRSRAPPTEA